MTTSTDIDQAAAYAATLRRIADLTEAGVLPLPVTNVAFSFWFREDQDGRPAALVAAEALGVDWRAARAASSSNSYRYLRAVATLRPAVPVDLSLYLDLGQPDEPTAPTPPPASVAFTAELNAAARCDTAAVTA